MSRLYDEFVTILGDIKIFRFPFWLVYDPGSYKVRGPEIRRLSSLVRPGDIFLRRYDGYLDSRLITGMFSHAALYLGDVSESDEVQVPEPARRSMFFTSGPDRVAHSTAEGVHLEDLLTFVQCDGLLLLRFPEILRKTTAVAPPAEFDSWHEDERNIFRRLDAGEEIPFQQVLPVVRPLALGQLGTPYDFSFDFCDGKRLSCTEFVAHCYRCLLPVHGIVPTRQSFLGGLRHEVVIRPDDFLKAPLERIHASPSIQEALQRTLRS